MDEHRQPGRSLQVLVELRLPKARGATYALQVARALRVPGFQLDVSYAPVPVAPPAQEDERLRSAGEELVVVRGEIAEERIPELEALPGVVRVWKDTPIAPFADRPADSRDFVQPVPPVAFGTCPVPPCDCDTMNPKGMLADVASYLGANQVWGSGFRGQSVVIGIVDGGISAIGRTPAGVIPRVTGGWPDDWGTRDIWSAHGHMTATDALGLAPEAHLFDIRIAAGSTSGTISAALAGYQWALMQHASTGAPQVLSNSWGIYQRSWDEVYATNPMHPFTRKVVEVIDAGILVLFAAGNCGERCPAGRCGDDTGPGRSIWGANGHPRVMSVGAANIEGQLVGYSSQGPAALSSTKPDFLAPSHFQGYFFVDTGTSAACPVAAGAVALLKDAFPWLTQEQAKEVLHASARDIGLSGWDIHTGAGVIHAGDAFARLALTFMDTVLKALDSPRI